MPQYSFGPFSLDPEARILLRDSEPVPMVGKVFDTLAVLVLNPGRLLDKDELLSRVWPGTTVEESNLSQCIFTVRKLLGDSPKDHRYIVTIAGRGYQFVAPVAQIPIPSVPKTPLPVAGQSHLSISTRTWLLLVGAAILVTAGLLLFLQRRHKPEQRELKVQQLTTNAPEFSLSRAIISPDGKYLAYGASGDIYVRLILTGESQLFTKPVGLGSDDIWFPVGWFPGADRILASSVRQTSDGQIFTGWTVPLLGGSATRLRDDAFVHSVSPDGSLVAFTTGHDRNWEPYMPDASFSTTDKEIWVMGSRGENARRVVAADELTFYRSVRWAPDGKRLAYIKARLTGKPSLLMAVESHDLVTNRSTVIMPDYDGSAFAWARDGRILYALPEPTSNQDDWNIWELSVDAETGKATARPKKITSFTGFGIQQITVSADGRRLTFVKSFHRATAYVANLTANYSVQSLHRLTLDELPSFPTAWTPDSKSIIFFSNPTGSFGIYKQRIERKIPEGIPTGPEKIRLVRVSPDGKWIIYSAYSDAKAQDRSTSTRFMRVLADGGPPQLIFETDATSFSFDCPRIPAVPCVVEARSANLKEESFWSFDWMNGRREALFKFDVSPDEDFQWTISPDGSHLAILSSSLQKREIELVALSGKLERKFEAKGWPHPQSVDWTADGRAVLLSFVGSSGATLGRVDFTGHVQPLFTLGGSSGTSGIASPDGRYLAVFGFSLAERNAWMIENF